jgi:hypothetical protein
VLLLYFDLFHGIDFTGWLVCALVDRGITALSNLLPQLIQIKELILTCVLIFTGLSDGRAVGHSSNPFESHMVFVAFHGVFQLH